jgi:predicted HTH transcriptional regulator
MTPVQLQAKLPPPDFRVRACYQHCVLRWVCNKPLTNTTLRQRFGIAEENYSMVSRVIRDAIDRGLIKKASTASHSTRDARYLPAWA